MTFLIKKCLDASDKVPRIYIHQKRELKTQKEPAHEGADKEDDQGNPDNHIPETLCQGFLSLFYFVGHFRYPSSVKCFKCF